MNKKYYLVIGIIIVLGLFLVLKKTHAPTISSDALFPTQEEKGETESTQSPPTSVAPASQNTSTGAQGVIETKKTFTLAEVAMHSTSNDCLSLINGKVYNLTAWITKHPGGEKAILSLCGKDGSSAFTGKHGGQMKPETILAGFEVGVLK